MTTDTARAAQLADLRNWAPDTAKSVEAMSDETVASAWADEEKRFRERMMGKTEGQVLYESAVSHYATGEYIPWVDVDEKTRRMFETDAAAVIAHYEATRGNELRRTRKAAFDAIRALRDHGIHGTATAIEVEFKAGEHHA